MASFDGDADLLSAITGETPDDAGRNSAEDEMEVDVGDEQSASATDGGEGTKKTATTDTVANGENSRPGVKGDDAEGDEEEGDVEGDPEVKVQGAEATAALRPRIPARPGVCARFAIASFNPQLDVFLMVRRKKTTIFIDAKEDSTVLELKRMISGITKVSPEDQKLFRDSSELDDKKKISDYGLNAGTAKPQLPATISLVFKDENGEWEGVDIASLSQPPELPEVMRQQEPSVADTA